MDRSEFQSIIDSGDFDLLKGKIESEWLDCKREIYLLDEDKGKRELAKDVSSFANSDEGGFILIGVGTEKNDQSQVDTIVRIRPFPENKVNIEQYHSVIKEWVFPAVDVKVEWKNYKQSNKGILIITVPPQSEGQKPFLISRTIEDSGKRTEILFGFVERKRANSIPKKMIELHQIFRDGMHYQTNIGKRFDDLYALVQGLNLPKIIPKKSNKQIGEKVSARISDAIMSGGLAGHRKLIIAGYTGEDVILPEWANSKSELIESFENPPVLRQHGWDIVVGERSQLIKGELRRAVDKDFMILDLYRDGTLIFGVIAERGFLTWGRIQNDLKINSLALIETVCNFVTLFKLVTEKYVPKPSEISIRIKLHDLHLGGEKSFMVPYAVGTYTSKQHDAPDNNFEKTILVDLSKSEFDSGQVSYHVVQEVYLWFGMGSNMIPYVIEKDGLKSIDGVQIKIIDATK